ncbi:MAG: hypothetical protein L6R43_01375, partial [Planctomycetes bacterium]|nr:hypothetical protein [Planctomycetota bacterium]
MEDARCVDVSPLIQADVDLDLVKKEFFVRRIYVPGVAAAGLVGDISRTMAIDKAVVAEWKRTQGCTTEAEQRAFARALARKHRRFPFPEDFKPVVRRLEEKLKD